MIQSKTEKDYHSYLRTFCGDFSEIGPGFDQPQFLVPTPTNVVETPEAYRIQLALPGFRKQQLHIRVEEDVLFISARVKREKKEEFKIFHRQEIFSSSFEKSILLPEDVNGDDIRASFKDGLLNIELPKSEHPGKSSLEISIH